MSRMSVVVDVRLVGVFAPRVFVGLVSVVRRRVVVLVLVDRSQVFDA
jgi:hypothetical protein